LLFSNRAQTAYSPDYESKQTGRPAAAAVFAAETYF